VTGALLQAAVSGNIKAIALILERTEGKIKDSLQVEGPETVIFRWASDEDEQEARNER
jgi:hypothetical protein